MRRGPAAEPCPDGAARRTPARARAHSPSPGAGSGGPRGAARGPPPQQHSQGVAVGAPGCAGPWRPAGCGGRAARAAGLRSGRPDRMCSMEKAQGRAGPPGLAAPPAAAMPSRPRRRGRGNIYIGAERAVIPGPGAESTRANPAAPAGGALIPGGGGGKSCGRPPGGVRGRTAAPRRPVPGRPLDAAEPPGPAPGAPLPSPPRPRRAARLFGALPGSGSRDGETRTDGAGPCPPNDCSPTSKGTQASWQPLPPVARLFGPKPPTRLGPGSPPPGGKGCEQEAPSAHQQSPKPAAGRPQSSAVSGPGEPRGPSPTLTPVPRSHPLLRRPGISPQHRGHPGPALLGAVLLKR